MTDDVDRGGYDAVPVFISAIIGLFVAILAVWFVSGRAALSESLFRIQPTVNEGGVGSEWVVGNTNPLLDFLIALTHAADVIMGVFILLMVFIHWLAFRRLANRMVQPDAEEYGDAVATDGGERE